MEIESLLYKVSELAQTGLAKGRELGEAGLAKAREMKEIGKLKVENASEQEAIKKAYVELGSLYYAEHGLEPGEAYAALCDKITASKAKIEYNLERIADIRAASGLDDEAFAEAECTCAEAECTCAEAEPESCSCGEDPAGPAGDESCDCCCHNEPEE